MNKMELKGFEKLEKFIEALSKEFKMTSGLGAILPLIYPSYFQHNVSLEVVTEDSYDKVGKISFRCTSQLNNSNNLEGELKFLWETSGSHTVRITGSWDENVNNAYELDVTFTVELGDDPSINFYDAVRDVFNRMDAYLSYHAK